MRARMSARRPLNRVGIGWAVLALTLPLSGRSAPAIKGESPYLAEAWRSDAGLPQNNVTSLLQTREGYLWIGTSNGLARFDGARFVTFRSVDTPAFKSNRILSLYQDSDGALWIGTEAGLMRYVAGEFTARTTRDGLSSDQVTSMGEDGQGRLWVGTQSGLNRWDQTRFASFFRIDGLPDDQVTAMILRRSGRLIFATGHGLASLSEDRLKPYRPAPELPPDRVHALWEDSAGNLWIAGEAGLGRVAAPEAGGGVWRAYSEPVLVLTEGATNELWFGTSGGIVYRLATNSAQAPPEKIIRFPAPVTALCRDREGNVWVGTGGDGLHRLRPRQLDLLAPPEGVPPSEVSSLVRTGSGAVWVAAGVNPLQVWQEGEWRRFQNAQFPEGAYVRTLAEDPRSGLWIGTLGEGLFRWQEGAVRRWSEREGLSDNAVEVLCADSQDGVWVGTRNGGLNHVVAGQVERFNTPWGFTGNYARELATGRDGGLWIGTSGDGLFHLAKGTFTAYTTRNGLPHNLVRALCRDEAGVLWAGTAGGLARIQEGRLTAFTAKDGLPEDAISQVQDDGRGNLWIGSNHGLYRLNKKQLQDYAEGRTRFLDAVSYGRSDEVADPQCLPDAQVSSGGGKAKRLWFPMSRGLIWVEPAKLHWNPVPPPVVIEQVLVENEAVALTEPIRVRPGKEKIQFRYTALSLTAPEKVRFRCQLSGFDRDWIEMGVNRTALYTRLPPGRYRFHVLACNNDGAWNETGAGVALVVAPFWWQTWWSKTAAAAAVAGLLAGLVQMRRTRRRLIENLRLRIASDLHDEIGSSIWSITLLSQLLHKYGAMGEEERHDVGEIHRIATQTANAVRDIVWLINPTFDTVQDLVMRMNDFGLTMLRGATFQLQSERANLARQLPFDFRQNAFLIYKETVTNIAKHARATRVEVVVEERADTWEIRIRDDGVGFDPSKVTNGNGLRNLRARAEKMNGAVIFETAPGQGTTVLVSIRL
jgi:ligand-binding sensor domain-containing protein/signal transduction histidine kinase